MAYPSGHPHYVAPHRIQASCRDGALFAESAWSRQIAVPSLHSNGDFFTSRPTTIGSRMALPAWSQVGLKTTPGSVACRQATRLLSALQAPWVIIAAAPRVAGSRTGVGMGCTRLELGPAVGQTELSASLLGRP